MRHEWNWHTAHCHLCGASTCSDVYQCPGDIRPIRALLRWFWFCASNHRAPEWPLRKRIAALEQKLEAAEAEVFAVADALGLANRSDSGEPVQRAPVAELVGEVGRLKQLAMAAEDAAWETEPTGRGGE